MTAQSAREQLADTLNTAAARGDEATDLVEGAVMTLGSHLRTHLRTLSAGSHSRSRIPFTLRALVSTETHLRHSRIGPFTLTPPSLKGGEWPPGHTPNGEHPVTTHRAIARRRYPRAEWITGEGPWASLAACGVLTVILYPTREQAETARAFIDQTGCGGGCYRDHAVVNIEGATR